MNMQFFVFIFIILCVEDNNKNFLCFLTFISCASQYEEYGRVSDSMLVNTVLMLVYVTKFFWWEAGYWNTMDIAHDRGIYVLLLFFQFNKYFSQFIFSSWALICIFSHGWYNNFWHLHVVFAAGFYICWGCLVWVPSIYTSPGMYLVKHPVDLGLQACLLFLRIFISQINTIQLSCF